MKNYILNIGKGMIFAGAISLASCTDGLIMSPLTKPPKTYWKEIT